VVGISGSSAPQLGISLLRALRECVEVETHLVVSAGGQQTLKLEAGIPLDEVLSLANFAYSASDQHAPISSGSFMTDGMVVMPCSMRTLGAIAAGNSQDLLTRAADVTLRERRRLVLVTREAPLNLIHIRNMAAATLAGATVHPPVLSFSLKPRTIDDLLTQIVGTVLDQFAIPHAPSCGSGTSRTG
jgi:polyprenyl P-hydroxybenzoate/phenylacrylic acid decarboxylase-like protein